MARTSSGGVSNSAAKEFSNCEGRIANDNYNRVIGNATVYEQLKAINGVKPLPVNRYPKLQPQSTLQVVKNSGLYH
jgi:hypothetical protein